MVLIPQAEWEKVSSTLEEVKVLLADKVKQEVNNQWMFSDEARKMLGVSQKTWQTYRDKRIIPFAQVGRKIYVKRADVESFMQNHFISKRVRTTLLTKRLWKTTLKV